MFAKRGAILSYAAISEIQIIYLKVKGMERKGLEVVWGVSS